MEDKGNNVINNYKGVMLCSRPNENNQGVVQRPFCSRVYNHDQLGLVPFKRQGSPPPQVKKQLPSILNKHKRWLQEFKQKQSKAKEQIEQKQRQQEQKFKKIRQMAQIDRDRARKMKNQYNQTATQVLNILDQSPAPSRPGELNAANLRRLNQANQQKQKEDQDEKRQKHTQQLFKKNKKIKKPEWAVTEQEREKKQQQQVDDLLDFFDNTEINQFSEDDQVKSILKNLKDKIQELKEKDDWRERQAKRIKDRQDKRRRDKQANEDDDKVTHYSGASESKSVASERAQKNIEELKKKKEEGQQWDKHTVTSKHSFANIDERIAKNLADQVLRNYPHLRGVHSNTSIRKLLEAEAAKAINEPIPRPVITTIIRDPKPLDTNNLPYLHRNPAI